MRGTEPSGSLQLHPTLGLEVRRSSTCLLLPLHSAQDLAVRIHEEVLVCLRRKKCQHPDDTLPLDLRQFVAKHRHDMPRPAPHPLVTKHRHTCTGYRTKHRIRLNSQLHARNPFLGISITGMLHPGGEDFMIIDENITSGYHYRAVDIYIPLSFDHYSGNNVIFVQIVVTLLGSYDYSLLS